MQTKVYIKDIIDVLGSEYIQIYGDTSGVFVDNVADVEHTTTTTLDWVNPQKTNKQEIAEHSVARVILVDEGVVYSDTLKQSDKEGDRHARKKSYAGQCPYQWC